MNSTINHTVGIDIAKDSLSVRLLSVGNSPTPVGEIKTFPNSSEGYTEMKRWLVEQGAEPASSQVIMEATGVYWEACALYCHQQHFVVSIVNPAQIKYFARTTLMRGKTDPLDADLIARFGAVMKPKAWTPPGIAFDDLQVLSRQRDAYVRMLTEEKNRLHALSHRAHCPKEVLRMTKAHIRFLEKQIDELGQAFKDHLDQTPAWKQTIEALTSITGIGMMTAGVLLTETLAFSTFVDGRQLNLQDWQSTLAASRLHGFGQRDPIQSCSEDVLRTLTGERQAGESRSRGCRQKTLDHCFCRCAITTTV